ncbi:Zinc phosphodiesterase [Entamoeba marina]
MDCIIPLGTCASWLTLYSNTTSNLIRLNEGNYIVIDYGTLYVTHLHIDHVGNIVKFANNCFLTKQFTIYGSKEIKQIIAGFEKFNGCCSHHDNVIELDDSLYQLPMLPNGTKVSYFKIPHGVPCYGYLFEDTNSIRVCHLGDTNGIDL